MDRFGEQEAAARNGGPGRVSFYRKIDAQTVQRHLEADTPFHVRGFARDWAAVGRWDFAKLKSRLAQQGEGRVFRRWFRGPASLLAEDLPTSPLLARFIDAPENFPVRDNKAIWLSPRGNVTSLHYDGWGFDGFNIQVTGHKRFTLYPPTTPFQKLPYMQTAEDSEANDRLKREQPGDAIDMRPGDLLFTPRFWYHEVRALADSSNVQYHLGRKSAPPLTRAALLYSLDAWTLLHCRALVPGPVLKEAEYPDILAHYARAVPRHAGLAHAVLQLARIAHKAAWDRGQLVSLRKTYGASTLDDLTRRAGT